MDPERGHMVKARRTHLARGDMLEKFSGMELSDVEFTQRAAWYLAHRVDLHDELEFLAIRRDHEGFPTEIVNGSEVVAFDATDSSITLANGDTQTADLIVAADGVHSQATRHVGHDNFAAPTGMSAFRFLIPSDTLREDPETASFLEDDEGRFKIFTGSGDRRLVWHACRKYDVSTQWLALPNYQ
jgi:salicylate hydroxylase